MLRFFFIWSDHVSVERSFLHSRVIETRTVNLSDEAMKPPGHMSYSKSEQDRFIQFEIKIQTEQIT